MSKPTTFHCEKHKKFAKVKRYYHEFDFKLECEKLMAELECGCKLWVATVERDSQQVLEYQKVKAKMGGKRKTHEQVMEEMRLRNEWLKRQPPLKSPCLKGRRRHCFGRGVGKIHKCCVYCGKSREQIRAEQGMVKQAKMNDGREKKGNEED